MKERELAQHTTCHFCGRLVTACGLPLFWKVTAQRFGLDARAMRRQMGMAQFIGSPSIASVMGPDEDLARPITECRTLTACDECATSAEAPPLMAAWDLAAAPSPNKEQTK